MSNGKSGKGSGYKCILIGAVIGIIWGLIGVKDSKYDKYYDAKINACPNKTLKQGLESMAESLKTSGGYKIYEAESRGGNKLIYLEFYGYYTPITYNNGTVTFGTIYNKKTNQVEYSYTFIENLLC